ncbi:ferro-O2-oxidoreductase [Apiospora phragmitis]|uniref:Ferro-O2-oxidoreductase n=1 Tax=Apiospora phragmitis TaxID=2905665 RepID=A0ABR1TX27_9PEZI
MLLVEDSSVRRRTSVTTQDENVQKRSGETEDSPQSETHGRPQDTLAYTPWTLSSFWAYRALIILFLFITASVALWKRGWWDRLSQASRATSLPKPDESLGAVGSKLLGIVLHPEDHAYRRPRNITLNWTVSAAVRAPDGVKKRVRKKGNGGDEEQQDVLLMIGDWFHRSADDVQAWYSNAASFGNEPVPDSLLINGVGRFDCSSAMPGRPVDCTTPTRTEEEEEETFGYLLPATMATDTTTTRLRLINVGTIAGFSVSAPGMSLQLVAVDGGFQVAADPVAALGIVYPGERVDVILKQKEKHADSISPRLHVYLDSENFKHPNPSLQPNQSFPLRRHHHHRGQQHHPSESNAIVRAAPPDLAPSPFLDLATVSAERAATQTMPATAQHTILLYVKTQKLSRYNNEPKGFINHTAWRAQTPPLLSLPRAEWDRHQLVPFIPVHNNNKSSSSSNTAWTNIVINNLDDGAHPFHLHGHSFYVLSRHRSATGWGSWNPYAAAAAQSPPLPPGGLLNLEAPLLKDTVSVPRRGHVVLRAPLELGGIWMLHCHMLVHLGSGMAAGIHVGPGSIDAKEHLDYSLDAARLCPQSGPSNEPDVEPGKEK